MQHKTWTGYGLHSELLTTIASQVQGNLAGRLVTRADIACSIKQGLGDVFRMAMQPEFNEVMDSVNQ